MSEIILTQGKVTLVDDDDYEWLSGWKWFAHRKKAWSGPTYYARNNTGTTTVMMHRVILGLKHGDNRQCDHIDGDGLNNQRSNLRVCTSRQNQYNRRGNRRGVSRYKGVGICSRSGKWIARIRKGRAGKQIYLSSFDSEAEAARCYDRAALKYFGEFARLNFREIERTKR